MDRPSISELSDLRVELSELKRDVDWQHKTQMAELSYIVELLSRPQSQALISSEALVRIAPYAISAVILIVTLLATGDARTAITTAAGMPR